MKMDNNTNFQKIIPTDDQVDVLYDLLNRRKHNISHQHKPTFEEHKTFVETHPYRSWYLITNCSRVIGSVYISNENTIGINIVTDEAEELVSSILKMITMNYAPLPPIQSVRAGVFGLNVSPSDHFMINSLKILGAEITQLSFVIK